MGGVEREWVRLEIKLIEGRKQRKLLRFNMKPDGGGGGRVTGSEIWNKGSPPKKKIWWRGGSRRWEHISLLQEWWSDVGRKKKTNE